ncbi:MAG: hypothetical protein LBI99_09275, partial [Propionibacteriaceae bacterium]|nr:hypothetical protein [Propionibacteriaceae bacterium]
MARKYKQNRESFGSIRELPSGRLQASYVGLDLQRHNAHTTFGTRQDARAWLNREYLRMGQTDPGDWKPPEVLLAEEQARRAHMLR